MMKVTETETKTKKNKEENNVKLNDGMADENDLLIRIIMNN